ncbi:hypothetical protein LOTGIDRAFT_175600 [Lottia gigantea]|uniref:WH2 domain-containing protein n=1 Tax=Lottia gigantea TaxID=225164 RepID=V4AIB1_LOTGI|nr:hypothetical protein LOTGIDRAFT_175600 [Lottia gigantea]ESO93176.1 hypothetical protein LOTGIDRAFT_175600 [Lottia gigantea]
MSEAAKRRHESNKPTAIKKASACSGDGIKIVEQSFDKNTSNRRNIEFEDGGDISSMGDAAQEYVNDDLDEEDMLAEIRRNEDQLKKVEADLKRGRIREELLESRRKLAEIKDQTEVKFGTSVS